MEEEINGRLCEVLAEACGCMPGLHSPVNLFLGQKVPATDVHHNGCVHVIYL